MAHRGRRRAMEAVQRGGGALALALLFLLLAPTLASAAHEDAPHPQPHPSKCLRSLDRPPPQRHVFFSGERLPLRLETSRRLTHRLAAQLLRIFLAEVQSYNGESRSMGSARKYGWFIPTTLFNASAGMGSWRFFKDPVQAQKFELTEDDFNYVKDIAIKSARSECADGQCNSWIYVPPWCNASDGSVLSPCATLLAGYQEETSFAKEDIEKLHLYVQIVWLGAHLANTTYDLMKRYHERSVSGSINHSLVVLVGVPDELIVSPNDEFRAIAMPQCNPSCNKSHDDCIQKCNYEMQRLVKLVWPALPASAKPAYEAIDEMTLDYAELLTLYRVYQNVEQTACAWMQKNEPIWEKWKKTGKNKLSIGGIFPITGSSHIYHGIVRAAEMALEAVNRNDSLLPDYNLSLKVNDGKCAADVVMKTFIDYVMDDLFRNLVGILGK
ncbi:Guanylate cyclase [Gryllus bimaculatus]|nr:Guanylate cyclase [Gryllus bimaculatus]